MCVCVDIYSILHMVYCSTLHVRISIKLISATRSGRLTGPYAALHGTGVEMDTACAHATFEYVRYVLRNRLMAASVHAQDASANTHFP